MPVNSFENYPMSWKPKLLKSKRPLYLTLANQLELDIEKEILLPGTKLPPQRELADFLDINVSTVSRAFKICSNKGILTGTVGSGTYVAYDINTNVFDFNNEKSSSFIDLGPLIPETIAQDEVTSILTKMLAEPDFAKLFQYNYETINWYKEVGAKLLLKLGHPAKAENVLFSSGGQNAIVAIFSGLFQSGDKIGTDPLVYPSLKNAAKLFGIQLVPIQQENNEMSEEGILHAYQNEGIKALYVMPDFQNPTTHVMSVKCRDMIARIAKKKGLLVIEDGSNSLLTKTPLSPISARDVENTIYIASLSKTVIPSLRLAYLGVPTKYYQALDNALYTINVTQSTFLTELASRIIVSGKLEELLETRRQGLRKRNKLVNEVLAGLDVCGSDKCINRWLILPPIITCKTFERLALEKGVHVYGSEHFVVGKKIPVSGVRLSICAPRTLEELAEGLKKIRDLL